MKGVLIFHSETGTEGGFWAFQDEAYIEPVSAEFPHGLWSYAGLHILTTGDKLTIFSKIDPALVLWTGEISLVEYPVFQQDASGWWIHADQKGIDREKWAEYFFCEYPAELSPSISSTI